MHALRRRARRRFAKRLCQRIMRRVTRGNCGRPDMKLKVLPGVASSSSDPIAGVVWITVSMALFAGLAVFSRQVMTAGLHPFEVVFLRTIFACVLLLPLLALRGRSLLHARKISLYA